MLTWNFLEEQASLLETWIKFLEEQASLMEMLGCWNSAKGMLVPVYYAKNLLGLQCVSIKRRQHKPASAWVTSTKVVFNYKPRSLPRGL